MDKHHSLQDWGKIYTGGRLFPIYVLLMFSSESDGQISSFHIRRFLPKTYLKGMGL